jgi:hypothetical protein
VGTAKDAAGSGAETTAGAAAVMASSFFSLASAAAAVAAAAEAAAAAACLALLDFLLMFLHLSFRSTEFRCWKTWGYLFKILAHFPTPNSSTPFLNWSSSV